MHTSQSNKLHTDRHLPGSLPQNSLPHNAAPRNSHNHASPHTARPTTPPEPSPVCNDERYQSLLPASAQSRCSRCGGADSQIPRAMSSSCFPRALRVVVARYRCSPAWELHGFCSRVVAAAHIPVYPRLQQVWIRFFVLPHVWSGTRAVAACAEWKQRHPFPHYHRDSPV